MLAHEQDKLVTRVLVVSSVLAIRAGIRTLLFSPELESMGRELSIESESPLEIVHETTSLVKLEYELGNVDVLLLFGDAFIPGELERIAKNYGPELGLLLVGDEPEIVRSLPLLGFRAWGWLPYDSSAIELVLAARAIDQGMLVGAPALIEPLFGRSLHNSLDPDKALVERLTERESEVLQLLADGLANKQIGVALNISEHTVKFHVSSIYAKLGVTNRAEAVRVGLQQGFISL